MYIWKYWKYENWLCIFVIKRTRFLMTTNERKLIKIKLTEVFRFVFGLKVNSFFFQVVNSMIFWMNTYYASLTKLLWVNNWILKVQLQNFILREKMFTLH